MAHHPCTYGSCRQQACLASGPLQFCGDHWRDNQAAMRSTIELSDRLEQLDNAVTLDDIKPLLRELIEARYIKD